MTTSYYKSIKNYSRPQSARPAHIPQPFLNYGGLTQMLNSDYQPPSKTTTTMIPKYSEPIQKNYQSRPLSATQRFEQNQKLRSERENKYSHRAYLNHTNPNAVEEAQSTYWMTHINSSDIYHSFIKGTNPWARSSAFTQPLSRTRGALGYYQNAVNNNMMYGFPGINAVQRKNLLEKEREKIEKGRQKMDKISQSGIRQYLVDKILKGCAKKGWIGLRALKCYLRRISPHDCDVIDKNMFKYYLDKQGIRLDLNEVNEIYNIYDKNKNGHINFIEFFNTIRTISESRMQQIDEFYEQVKEKNSEKNFVFFSKLERIADMRFHPEVMRYQKSANQVRLEYQNFWDKYKIEDVISEEQFKQFFYDISSVVENDRDFIQILKALGYK